MHTVDLGGRVTAMALRDGLVVAATTGPDELALIDPASWKQRRVALPAPPVCLTVATDDTFVVVGAGQERSGRVVMVDVATASVTQVLKARMPVTAVALSPQQDRVTAAAGRAVLTWPLGGRPSPATTLLRTKEQTYLAGVTPAGLVLAYSYRDSVVALDPTSGQVAWSTPSYSHTEVRGRRVVSRYGREIRELDPVTGEVLHTWQTPAAPLHFAATEDLIATTFIGARIHFVHRDDETWPVHDGAGHDDRIAAHAFDGDRFATVGHDGQVCVWTRGRGKPDLLVDAPHRGGWANSAVHLDGDLLHTGINWYVERWSLSGPTLLAKSGPLSRPASLVFPVPGTDLLVVATEASRRYPGMIYLLDAHTLEALFEQRVDHTYQRARRLDADRVELTGGLATLILDVSARAVVGERVTPSQDHSCRHLLSTDGSLLVETKTSAVAAGDPGRGWIFATDTATNIPCHERRETEPHVGWAALSADGLLATSHEDAIRLWEARAGTLLRELPPAGYLADLHFWPDGSALLAASANGALHEIPL